MSWWHDSHSRLRANRLALGLVVAVVWMVNALNNRPYDHQAERQMEKALLPQERTEVVQDEDNLNSLVGVNETETKACNPYNIFFISAIKCDVGTITCPRLHASICIEPKTFRALTGGMSYDACSIAAHAESTNGATKALPNPGRVSNKAASKLVERLLPQEIVVTTIDEIAHQFNNVNLEDEGSDLDDEHAPPVHKTAAGVNEETSRVWVQFLSDTLIKSPNMGLSSRAPSYLILSGAERRAQCTTVFVTVDLHRFFRRFSVRIATDDEWDALFRLCWPLTPHAPSPSSQNWRSVKWLSVWQYLLSLLDDGGKRAARRAIREQFYNLRWYPDATSDRIWNTRCRSGFDVYPRGEGLTAPRILINPRFAGEWAEPLQ